jgi:hypothetical protein
VSSYGSAPASTVASVRPAWAMTCVLAAKSMPACTGPPGHCSRSRSATCRERTQRLRYHSARPSRSRTPCTMPGPRNQCWSGSSEPSGLGPLRRYRPFRQRGRPPVTGRSNAVISSVTGANGPWTNRLWSRIEWSGMWSPRRIVGLRLRVVPGAPESGPLPLPPEDDRRSHRAPVPAPGPLGRCRSSGPMAGRPWFPSDRGGRPGHRECRHPPGETGRRDARHGAAPLDDEAVHLFRR